MGQEYAMLLRENLNMFYLMVAHTINIVDQILQNWMKPGTKMVADGDNYIFLTPSVLPDSNGGFTPCPEVLTEEEAIRYLRLDLEAHSDSRQTLKYYRDKGELVAIRIGRRNRYRRRDLDDFLSRKSEAKWIR
jgi:hypothetical protein